MFRSLRRSVAACTAWLALVVLTGIVGSTAANAQTFEVIHAFENVSAPYAPLVQGPDGAFYGTTSGGGAYGGGAIFRVVLDGATWRRSIVHNFKTEEGTRPWSGLTLGPDNALYGTTSSTVYRLGNLGESPSFAVLV